MKKQDDIIISNVTEKITLVHSLNKTELLYKKLLFL